MRIVLFLGAGFSRAWGLPVMKEFFQHAKDSEHLTNEDKDFLRDLQSRAQKGVSMFQVRHDNLEEILSFCLAASNFGTGYPDKSNSEYKKLCQILQNVYRQINLKELHRSNGMIDACQRLLAFKDRHTPHSYELVIITTNYDIMAEFCLRAVGFRFQLPSEWLPVCDSKNDLYIKDSTGSLLCKLHGSLNWYMDTTNENSLRVESSLVHCTYDPGIEDNSGWPKEIWFPKVSLRDYTSPSEPVIIPPTLFKMQTDPRFQTIWRSAGEMLRTADKLVFIGFSFPESDTHIRYFLAANLYENVDLRSIDIVDPNANEICDRLRDRSAFGIHFKDRLKPVQGKWEEIDYSINSLI